MKMPTIHSIVLKGLLADSVGPDQTVNKEAELGSRSPQMLEDVFT